jgi:hypothetical protein
MPRVLRSRDQLEFALALVQQGHSLHEAQRRTGVNRKSLTRLARERAIPISRPGHPERYPLDHAAFAAPVSLDAAYVGGVLAGDGNLYLPKDGRAPMLSVKVRAGDAEVLLRVVSVLGTSVQRIYEYDAVVGGRRYPVAALQVSSARIAADLAALGVVPGKTARLQFPAVLPLELQRHWIRGVYDADGVTAYRRGGRVLAQHLGFTGSRALVGTLATTLATRCGLSLCPTVRPSTAAQTCWVIAWRRWDDVARIVSYMYANGGAAYCLQRKYLALCDALGLAPATALDTIPRLLARGVDRYGWPRGHARPTHAVA